jgi:hypothetical protein
MTGMWVRLLRVVVMQGFAYALYGNGMIGIYGL